MKKNKNFPTATINYYYPLLQRYASSLIHDSDQADRIAKAVLQDQYNENGLKETKDLRQKLKKDVINRCYYWEQAQIFVRPLIKVPFETSSRKFEKG
jgi:hypothetical protein